MHRFIHVDWIFIYINKVAVCVFVCPEHFPLQLSQLPKSQFQLLPLGGKQPIQSPTFVL